MKGADVLFSKGKDTWQTPECVLERVRALTAGGSIACDPCTTRENPTHALVFFTEQSDGLTKQWQRYGVCFVNPPYSQAGKWIAKCEEQHAHGCTIVALVAARTDTRWFHAAKPNAIAFWRGRITFIDPVTNEPAAAGASFPSALLYWGTERERFAEAFANCRVLI